MRHRTKADWAIYATIAAALVTAISCFALAYGWSPPRVQLGTVGEWLAALFAAVAAGAALHIAGRDRQIRALERRDAAEAQARLVRVEVKMLRSFRAAVFSVRIHNHSDRAIIGAAVVAAWWPGHPNYSWRHADIEHDREPIVVPASQRDSGGQVQIEFLDSAGNQTPTPGTTDRDGNPVYDKLAVLPDAVVCFMDADGTLWKVGTSTGPERLNQRPTSLDPGGPVTR